LRLISIPAVPQCIPNLYIKVTIGRGMIVASEKMWILMQYFESFLRLGSRFLNRMNYMKRIGLLLLAVMSLVSCSKMVTMESIVGSWTEQYDPSVFAMDGSVDFCFESDNEYWLTIYDALSGGISTSNGHYVLKGNTITLYPEASIASIEGGSITYKVVKLTADEMEWQKEGTKYSKGTWGSDYRHFVRVRWVN